MKRVIGIAILVPILVLIYAAIAGFAVVVDQTGNVVSAVITNDHREQALVAVGGAYFYATPHIEGTIEVRCRGGSHNRTGYVSPHLHTVIRVTETDCRKVVHQLMAALTQTPR